MIFKRLFQSFRSTYRAGPEFHPTDWQATHIHKSGGHYRRICDGILETDRSPVTIYDDQSGQIWVRPSAEFDDGRFQPLA